MDIQTYFKMGSALVSNFLFPHTLSKTKDAEKPVNSSSSVHTSAKALKVLEYGTGFMDGINPFTPVVDDIQKRLNLEPKHKQSFDYQTGKRDGSLVGIAADAYLTKAGATSMTASAACEVTSAGACTLVAAPAASAGAIAAASGIMMSAGHGRNLVEAQNKINVESISKTESPKITEADIKDKTRTEIRELAKEKGLKEFGEPDPKDGLVRKWKDPVTNEQRLRLDRGHIDKETGKPYDIENAAVDHVHAMEPDGASYIKDSFTNDYHFPTRGE